MTSLTHSKTAQPGSANQFLALCKRTCGRLLMCSFLSFFKLSKRGSLSVRWGLFWGKSLLLFGGKFCYGKFFALTETPYFSQTTFPTQHTPHTDLYLYANFYTLNLFVKFVFFCVHIWDIE